MTKSHKRSPRHLSDTALILLGRAADSEDQMLLPPGGRTMPDSTGCASRRPGSRRSVCRRWPAAWRASRPVRL
jgi:hypothetical protein